jgi:hypothetical protein
LTLASVYTPSAFSVGARGLYSSIHSKVSILVIWDEANDEL